MSVLGLLDANARCGAAPVGGSGDRDRRASAWRGLAALLMAGLVMGLPGSGAGGALAAEMAAKHPGKFRVLHIMSYHASWDWNRDQFDAFREALGDLDVEYEVFEMDTKRRSDPEWKREAGRRARALIEFYGPDLVYTNDDNAQALVVQPYTGTGLPFVFSGVNADPSKYGFDRRHDVTGVLEQEHFTQTVQLLREIAPGVRRIAVLLDDDPTWTGVVARMRAALKDLPDLEVVSWDTPRTFEEYQKLVMGYQDKVDALAILGVFGLQDAQGHNLPFEKVLKWTAENSRLPDFSFWGSRVEQGTLCAVTVSGRAQGRAAGEIAHEILVAGRSPHSIPMRPTVKGAPVISLARAKRLGLPVPSSTLLKSQVLTKFAWE